MSDNSSSAIDLYWLPLGADGHFVRMNGRIYEALAAWRNTRPRYELFHSAIVVTLPLGNFVIEQAWPIPRGDRRLRGVVSEGPVGTRLARVSRLLRYEIRRWPDGVISDIDRAVASPVSLSRDVVVAARILELVSEVPTPVWGRNELQAGEMWNSNSLISWLIVRSGLDVDAVQPPVGGRAPGWQAGIVVARRQQERAGGSREPAPRAEIVDVSPSGLA